MSKKLTGNGLWESSRMMLPSHKESINQNLIQQKSTVKPVIHADEWDMILTDLNESYSQKSAVKVEIFGSISSRDVIGVVTAFNQFQKKFKLEFEEGYEWIDFKEIVSVRRI